MSVKEPMAAAPEEFVDRVVSGIGQDGQIRKSLPDGGRIHLDRPLPFLAAHALQESAYVTAAERITMACPAYVLWPSGSESTASELIGKAARKLKGQLGEFLLFELYDLPSEYTAPESSELVDYRYAISVSDDALAKACGEQLADHLQGLKLELRKPTTELVPRPDTLGPPPADQPWVALGIPRIYEIAGGEDVYPELLHAVETGVLDQLLHSACHVVSRSSQKTPKHYRQLGRSGFVKAAQTIDRKLTKIGSSFDFLLDISPINTEAAWRNFKKSGYSTPPRFRYRPIAIDISEQKRRLFSIKIDRAEDPLLEGLFREKQREIDIQLTMLGCRGTASFPHASVMLYGTVEDMLAEQAVAVLDAINNMSTPDRTGDENCDAHAVRAAAEDLCKRYRDIYPAFRPKISIREDVAGLMVSGSRLLISSHTNMKRARLDALLSHEISIHLLTYFTGAAQGLRMFRAGLAGYEGIQEGLGVFAEYAVGGLSLARIKLIAARVVAVNAMLNHASFIDTFHLLHDRHGYSARGAFNTAARVYRSGGLAKDAIYFKGFSKLLDMLANGESLDPFWFGKIDTTHIEAVRELRGRGFLTDPPIKPEFLSRPAAQRNIDRARTGVDIADLIKEQHQ